MVRLGWYSRLELSPTTEDAVRESFVHTLLESNRDVDFFVDWRKVRENVDRQAGALALLSEVRGSTDPLQKLKSIILVRPQALQALPMLLAWREDRWVILEQGPEGEFHGSTFDFSGTRRITADEATRITRFCEASGILRVLTETDDLRAYLLGVEAGMDTNARKNRSGAFMESHVDPYVEKIEKNAPGWRVFRQKSFHHLRDLGISVPEGLLARRFDFAFVGSNRRVSVEVNFYDKLGSKPQEIVDSYIQRAEELRKAGWDFVWITDGPGWRDEPSQIAKAFHRLDAVLNLAFCRRGVLDDVLSAASSPDRHQLPSSAAGQASESRQSPGLDGWT